MIKVISRQRNIIRYNIDVSFYDSEFVSYPDFGLFLWKDKESLLCVKAGKIGQHGLGGHNHIDFGSISLIYRGQDILNDRGTYCYTSDRVRRDIDRSENTHNCPRIEGLTLERAFNGTFGMNNIFNCRAVEANKSKVTILHEGYGFLVGRTVEVRKSAVTVTDFHEGHSGNHLALVLTPLSPYRGYGIEHE
jgi:hypothetical protein